MLTASRVLPSNALQVGQDRRYVKAAVLSWSKKMTKLERP
jgi:hypothetical protein